MKKTPSKKNRSGSKASPMAGGSPAVSSPFRDTNANGSMNFNVLFHARSSVGDTTACPGPVCMLSPGDMKKLKLFGGSCVTIQLPGENVVLLQAIPSPKTLSGSLILSRLWSSNFAEQSSSRKVAAIGDFGRTQVLEATSISFSVPEDSLEAVRTSAFLLYFRGVLRDLTGGLTPRNSVSVLWKAKTLNVTVLSVNGSGLEDAAVTDITQDDFSPPRRHVVSRSTSVTFCLAEPQNDVQFAMTMDLDAEEGDDIAIDTVPLSTASVAAIPTLPNFGGYAACVQEAWELLMRGLEMDIPRGHGGHDMSIVSKPPRGMLLYGPSGTGKTSLMRKLAATANVAVEEISHSIILSRVVGDAEMELRKLFVRAASRSPCVVLVDDIDALCPQRGSDQTAASDVQQRLTSSLLSILDGAASLSRVFVIATSASPAKIDSAMRRPGRLEKEIELSVPTPMDREDILYRVLKHMDVHVSRRDEPEASRDVVSRVTWNGLRDAARKAHGMVASDLVLVCKEAMVRIVNKHPQQQQDQATFLGAENTTIALGDDDLLSAVDKVVPSAIREVAVDVPCVRWTDIGGMDEVKKSLREVVEWPLLYPELFSSMNLPPPKGVLLYGPPGCSKTLMAKALATESGMNFLAVRGPELLSKWLGDSEKAVQTLFRRARAVAPSIVFFDEIDALATKRGSSSSGVNDRVLAQLLTELDGPQNSAAHRVVVVAATNRPDILDPALMRPGRIDRKIYVPPPDVGSRQQIIESQIKKLPCLEPINVSEIVALSAGFSGAEVVALFQEAAIVAIEGKSEAISQVHLLAAVKKTKPQISVDVLAFYDRFRSGTDAFRT